MQLPFIYFALVPLRALRTCAPEKYSSYYKNSLIVSFLNRVLMFVLKMHSGIE